MFHPGGGQRKGFAAQQILPAAAGYFKYCLGSMRQALSLYASVPKLPMN